MVNQELQIAECSFGEIERAAKPDVGGLPLGANQSAGSPGGAEAARTFLPTAVVKIRFGPIVGRFFCRESPGDREQASIGYNWFVLGRSRQRRPRSMFISGCPLL